jgi:LysM repeat protein
MAGRGLVLIVVIAALAVVAARFPGPARPEGAGASQPSAFSALAKSVLASPAAPSSTPSRSAPTTPTATLAATPVATPATTPLPSAPTPTAAALQPSVGARTYRVNSGDTLSAIAARFSVSVAAIQQLNGIKDPRLLQVGQVLRIP